MNANGHVGLWIAGAILAFALAGTTWAGGEQTERVNGHETRITAVEQTQKKIQDTIGEIKLNQAVLITKFDNMAHEQKSYQDRTTKTLEHISRKLND